MLTLQQIRADAKLFMSLDLTNDVTFTDLLGNSVTVKCKTPEHHTSYDNEGNEVSALNSHVEVNELTLNEAGYITRDSKNRVSLKNHIVKYADINGNDVEYRIRHFMPDSMLGIIVCELEFIDKV